MNCCPNCGHTLYESIADSLEMRIDRMREKLFAQCHREGWSVFADDTVRAETAAKLTGYALKTLEFWRTQRDPCLPWSRRKWPIYPLRGIAEFMVREKIDPECP